MNNIVDASTDGKHVAPAAQLLGPLLQGARQRRKLTIEDVSNRLRISLRQVNALETDDFAALPEAMITRGFIRNYARLLEIDAAPLLDAYRASAPSEQPRAISIQSEQTLILGGDRPHWRLYILASLLIAVLVGAWLIFMDYRPHLPARPAVGPLASGRNTPTDTAVEQKTVSEPLPVPALPAAEREPETGAAVVAAPATAKDDAIADKTTATLKFSFSNETWISVKDGADKQILNKNKPAGSEDTVTGQPPFKIVIGNAIGSTLIYKDKPVDLGPYTKGSVVRLTLE